MLRRHAATRVFISGHALVVLGVLGPVVACASSDGAGGGDGPQIVVTTGILGDVVEQVVGDEASVEVLMPAGTDPHEFQPSAQQVAEMTGADVVVVNGAGLEAGLADTVDAAAGDGVPICTAIDYVDTLTIGSAAAASGAEDEDHEEADRQEGDVDPHFFTDPSRMAAAVQGLADCLAEAVPSLDRTAIEDGSEEYAAMLLDLDAEIAAMLDEVPVDERLLVTNHESLTYFADRYGFEILGVIIPGGSTLAEANAGALSDLVDLVEQRGVKAVFVDASASSDLGEALAADAGDVDVVVLYTESLGEPGSGASTYLDLVRVNAERVAEALVG